MGTLTTIEQPAPLVKVEAVANYLCCAPATVLRMARKNELPGARPVRAGLRTMGRFNLDTVKAWAEAKDTKIA